MRRMIPHSEWEKLKKAVEEIPDPVTVDSELSGTSENPVQNKVINTALADKQSKLTTTSVPNNTDGYLNTLIGFDTDGNLKKQAPQAAGGTGGATYYDISLSDNSWVFDNETNPDTDYYYVWTAPSSAGITAGSKIILQPAPGPTVEDTYNNIQSFNEGRAHVQELGTNTVTIRCLNNEVESIRIWIFN